MPAPADQPAVTLRPVQAADLDAFFAYQLDEAADYMAAFLPREPDDRAAFDAHWSKCAADPTVVWRAVLADGVLVGHIAKFERDGEPEVTYWIDRAWWGCGVATAALRLLLAEVPTRPIYAGAAGDNVGSLRVLEKCGFVRTHTGRSFARARGGEIEEIRYILR